MIDLGPTAQRMAELLAGVKDDQLGLPTPCPDYTLGDLIDHIDGLTLAFTFAATKEKLPVDGDPPLGDGSRLGEDWRERIDGRLTALAAAWRVESAWQGMTTAGGFDLPGEIAGIIALDELVIHGWDVARAADLPYEPGAAEVAACAGFLAPSAEDRKAGDAFGPVVPVPDDASEVDRLIGLSGRDPGWCAV
ncbi:TIGR03086 family protein [Amycolatopsis xylanica]|uniref:TIGR03086 family protein n=1 Tax=Amycolatopsis xylanica TaxID=589385 RepID=A0A1H2UK02_9PSEU|nr:TIGR03086 family metal-binding protein [Amycolatopsis xylanica]SDW56465.1 TIGR03086 family protein [Amycolatopsis xylanica]